MYKYVVFWLSQAVSQLGSSLTSYALILWVYEQEHSAMDVSLMSFCMYIPYILVGTGAGAGMSVMFLCTGTLGTISSLFAYASPAVKHLKKEMDMSDETGRH